MTEEEISSEKDEWITFRTQSRRVIRPLMKQKENSVESIRKKFIEKGCMTTMQRGSHDQRAEILKRVFQPQSGGCIFVDGNMFDIFNWDKRSENSSNTYDVVIITKERPVCVLTVIEDGGSDEDAKNHNEILSNKLKLSLLMFTGRNITTICTVVKGSIMKEELLSKLDEAVEEEAQLTNPDKLYMDDRKRDDVTTAFITCLAFMTNRPEKSDIPGRDETLHCMTLSDFEKVYSVPASEEEGNEPQKEYVASVSEKPDSTTKPKNTHCTPRYGNQKTWAANPSVPIPVQ